MRVIYLLPYVIFFFNDTATTEIYTLSLHDALPIFKLTSSGSGRRKRRYSSSRARARAWRSSSAGRSEEHTSELQSQSNLVCRLLLEKITNNYFKTLCGDDGLTKIPSRVVK